jgi:hypothetical protein
MDRLSDLVRRTGLLQLQVEELRTEIVQLRKVLSRIVSEQKANGTAPAVDCLAVALASAQELGPEFSSEDPHRLADRGEGWLNGS